MGVIFYQNQALRYNRGILNSCFNLDEMARSIARSANGATRR